MKAGLFPRMVCTAIAAFVTTSHFTDAQTTASSQADEIGRRKAENEKLRTENQKLQQALAEQSKGTGSPQQPPMVEAADAVLIGKENGVEICGADGQWKPIEIGMKIAAGCRVRTKENSRAEVRMPNGAIMRIDELTTFEVTPKALRPDIKVQKRGDIYFFEREKEDTTIKIKTPAANGKISG